LLQFEGGSCSNYASGSEKVYSLKVVPYRGEELKRIETLVVNPIAVMDELELPESKFSDWVFQRVKFFCHVVGLSCEGFEELMMTLCTGIEASRNQNGLFSDPKFCSKLYNRGK
jgi:hypothetical protein